MAFSRTVRSIALATALAAAPSALTACGSDDKEEKGLTDVASVYHDPRGVVTIDNADKYPNVNIKCRFGDAFLTTIDDMGGQRLVFDRDSKQCDGNKVRLLPSDERTPKEFDPRVATNRPSAESTTEVQRAPTTTTTLAPEFPGN